MAEILTSFPELSPKERNEIVGTLFLNIKLKSYLSRILDVETRNDFKQDLFLKLLLLPPKDFAKKYFENTLENFIFGPVCKHVFEEYNSGFRKYYSAHKEYDSEADGYYKIPEEETVKEKQEREILIKACLKEIDNLPDLQRTLILLFAKTGTAKGVMAEIRKRKNTISDCTLRPILDDARHSIQINLFRKGIINKIIKPRFIRYFNAEQKRAKWNQSSPRIVMQIVNALLKLMTARWNDKMSWADKVCYIMMEKRIPMTAMDIAKVVMEYESGKDYKVTTLRAHVANGITRRAALGLILYKKNPNGREGTEYYLPDFILSNISNVKYNKAMQKSVERVGPETAQFWYVLKQMYDQRNKGSVDVTQHDALDDFNLEPYTLNPNFSLSVNDLLPAAAID